MQTLQGLRTKIDSAEGLQSVVKTMKAMASVNIRQYEESVASLRTYHQTVETGWQIVLGAATRDDTITLPTGVDPAHDEDPCLYVALGSDQGMCGQFDRIMSEFVLDAVQAEDREIGLLVAGERLRGHLEEGPMEQWGRLELPRSAAGLTDAVESALHGIDTARTDHSPGAIVLFHHEPTGGTSYEPRRRALLPLDPHWLDELRERAWSERGLPRPLSPLPVHVDTLTRETLFVLLFRGFAASLAAENASRLAAMQAAESSIEDRLEELWQDYHRQRQSAITQELLEVVSGFEQAGVDDTDAEDPAP